MSDATIPDAFLPLLGDDVKAFANLATLLPDGSPQVTPVRFDYTDGKIRVNSAKARWKDRNMRRYGRVAGAAQAGAGPGNQPPRRRPVDAVLLSPRTHDNRPMVPGWLRNRAEFRARVVWLGRYGAHSVGFHAPRIPTLYAARLAWRSPAGGWRVARLVFGWVFDHEQAGVRADAVRRNATTEYLTLSRQRNQRVRQRGTVVAVGLLLVITGVWVFTATAPPWAQALAVALAGAGLGVGGTPGVQPALP